MKTQIITALLLLSTATSVLAADNQAKDVFTAKCGICHGADGAGKTAIGKNLKIRDFHLPDVQKQSDADLREIILNGKNKMPAFKGKVTEAQVNDLVAYVRTLGK